VATGYDDGIGVRQNTIMYRAFLNTSQLKKYLLLLSNYGMLSYDSSMRRFRITGKVYDFLKFMITWAI
jgi:predicted transcriptional regulator